MRSRKRVFSFLLVISLCLNFLAFPLGPAAPVSAAALPLIDNFENGLPVGVDANGVALGFVTFNDNNSTVAIATTAAPPAPVPGAAVPNNVLQMDVSVVSYAGFVHNFENGALNAWVSQDWSAYEGISFWLYGNNSGTTLFVDVLDNRNPGSIRDDAERWSTEVPDNFSGWKQIKLPFTSFHRKEIGNGAPNDGFGLAEVYGWALGAVTTPAPQVYFVDDAAVYGTAPEKPLTVSFTTIDYAVMEGATATITAKLSKPSAGPVTVQYATKYGAAVANSDYTPVSGTLTFAPNITQMSFSVTTFDNAKFQGERGLLLELSNPTGGASLGQPAVARLNIKDNESYDAYLLEDFESYPYLWSAPGNRILSLAEVTPGEHALQVSKPNTSAASLFKRGYPTGQDWSAAGSFSFLYYGQNTRKDITVSLTNNASGVGDPASWSLVWSDEFNGKAGAAANPNTWGQEVGDGTVNGIPGWGNSELEYYTGGTANAAQDGKGSLIITTKKADGSLTCYYGPCQYTSARLLTNKRFEVAYGRVEARIKVAQGAGLWPAFWMLGTNLDQVGWPQGGEIDIMEYVGRVPNQVFGTLHGPGYSGGQSYGSVYDVGALVSSAYHVFAVDWQPNKITWSVDGVPYFTATPDDAFLNGKEWVFNHPFYILMNVAIGGNFGGAVGPETTFPQTTKIDYVRIYQKPAQPVTFTTTIKDNFTGWQKITLPFTAFTNPTGAVLDTAAITSLGFQIPGGLNKPVMIDQIRLLCPPAVTVKSTADSGAGSLRQALNAVCPGGTITFDPALTDQEITLTSGPYTLGKNVTIDGSAAPGLALSGNDAYRVFEVNAGTTAVVKALTITKGYGWQLGGGVLNNGSLTLDHVTVTANTMQTNAGDYWQGGGGIYNGGGATLNLVDSTVSDNDARWSGGGVYSFFNTTTNITRSTISGNTSGDVGGAIRSLGTMTIENSTLSGNTATGWHGGAIFHTDGTMLIRFSTITDNKGSSGAPSTIFNGSFGGPAPTMTIDHTIITGNQWYACDHWTGANTLISGGGNIFQDDTCSPAAGDLINGNALLEPLADNGGPTFTHALLPGSPAINAGGTDACPATDQRGVPRPQGAQCDIGAFEAQ